MTYRERYPVTLFCWERGTADTLFFLQNQPLSTAQQASSVLRAGARSGLRVAPPCSTLVAGAPRPGSYSSFWCFARTRYHVTG